MAFSKEQLSKFANLARIDISPDMLEAMQIDSVIEWLDKLQAIDTTGITPMITPVEHDLPLRDDVVMDGDNHDNILINTPDKSGIKAGYFAVPKVIDE